MSIDTNKLLLYKDLEHQDIFDDMVYIINNYDAVAVKDENFIQKIYKTVGAIIEFSEHMGFCGNLWQNFLTFLLVHSQNAFSSSSELSESASPTLKEAALLDCKIFKVLFDVNFNEIANKTSCPVLLMISEYKAANQDSKRFNARIKDQILSLTKNLANATDENEFLLALTAFYKQFGVGDFGLHKAFRLKDTNGSDAVILPILKTHHIKLDDLVGYQWQKDILCKNTENFLNGQKANNVLLYGDSGTGKSSSIKAILNKYYIDGLRIIEIYKHQFNKLSSIIEQVRHRNYKFIIYMDDLSFEDSEVEYKYLKAIIEGDLETRPDNVLIYATSNRRHLIKEQFSDRDDMDADLHRSDTMQEKLSLAARFGLTILYPSPGKLEYQEIIRALAKKANLDISDDRLMLEANRWELNHGGFSGRNAEQFIIYLSGEYSK